ncbi:hypothetical protein [Aeromicrobium sp. CTD01-1L150]|uniref:hypothetical protein n=1 Tax=Aeromicrobium sp. CTD01-1L150 TaxID=3341830 RepID=UPI0035C0B2FD
MKRTRERTIGARAMRAGAMIAATGLILAGCGGGDEAADEAPQDDAGQTAQDAQDGDAEGVQVDVEIADGEVSPQGERVEVTVGEPITISVTSDHEDEIHVHADPEVSIFAEPGETVEETFTIDTPGQAAVESHHLGVTIVQLVVRP